MQGYLLTFKCNKMTDKEILTYEVGQMTFFQSLLYTNFHSYFMWVLKRKIKRYRHFENRTNGMIVDRKGRLLPQIHINENKQTI